MGIRLGAITEWASSLLGSYKIPFTTGSLTRLVRMDTLADWVLKTYTGFLQSGTGAVSEPVQTTLRRIVWVEQYGAVGDGVTDDKAAIDRAVVAANGGIVNFLATSYYLASGLAAITKPITLQGRGYGRGLNSSATANRVTTLTFGAASGDAINAVINSGNALSGLVIRDLNIEGNRAVGGATTGTGLHIGGTTGVENWTLDNVRISDFKQYGVLIDGAAFLGDIRNSVFSHNAVDGVREVNSGSSVFSQNRFYACTFDANDGQGYFKNYATSNDTDFFGCTWNNNLDNGLKTLGNVNVFGGHFESNTNADISAAWPIRVYSPSMGGSPVGIDLLAGSSGSQVAIYRDANAATADIRIAATVDSTVIMPSHGKVGVTPTVTDAGTNTTNLSPASLGVFKFGGQGQFSGPNSASQLRLVDATDGTTFYVLTNNDLTSLLNNAAATMLSLNGAAPTSGNTVATIRYHNGTSVVTSLVTIGAADSGGAGFKLLRVAN